MQIVLRTPRFRPLAIVAAAALVLATACVPVPVVWDERDEVREGALDDSLRLSMSDDGAVHWGGAWSPPSWPTDSGLCAPTLRAARALGDTTYASWFAVRTDSSVILRVARSDDGGRTWRTAINADTMDRGRAGCSRPVPSIFADSLNGDVHLAYFLDSKEGAGLFFAHSMDRGAYFHEPVPIVYGDRPSSAMVTSRGDTVVIAFEDPNARQPRIGLALSSKQGHIFEHRVSASDDIGEARTPRVALRGTRIVLAWTTTQRGGGVPRTALRRGTLHW